MLTGLLLIILVLAGVATAAAMVPRRRALPGGSVKALPPGAEEGELSMRTLRDLRTGDVVTLETRDYLVEGVVAYEEDGHRWNAGRLVDGGDERWLVTGLERGGAETTRLVQPDPDVDMSGYPPEVLVAGDVRYTLEKRGTATARLAGNTGLRTAGVAGGGAGTVERCRWWLYEAPGDDTLLVEQWSDTYRVLRGKKVSPTMMELIPGS